MIIRNATAVWQGTGKEGSGHISTQTKALDQSKYSYTSRFEDGRGTNPEELIAAAHAGCFTMKLSFVLNAAGFTADELNTKCDISFDNGTITKSHLTVTAKVPGITPEQFAEAVADAEKNCPISKLLNAEITSEHTLN